MRISFLYLALEKDDYQIENPGLTSDFDFQTDFIFNYFSRVLAKEKFEAEKFRFITIRGRKYPKANLILKEHFSSLEIEIPFNITKYKELYPFTNSYPLKGKLIKPVLKKEAFCNFIFEMIMEGLEKGLKLDAPIPYDFLVNRMLDFKNENFKNEWIYKAKAFKEYGIKAILYCVLTVNYFSLELIIEKGKKVIYKKEILKTTPSPIIYKNEFKHLEIQDGNLIVTKDMNNRLPLFRLPLKELQLTKLL